MADGDVLSIVASHQAFAAPTGGGGGGVPRYAWLSAYSAPTWAGGSIVHSWPLPWALTEGDDTLWDAGTARFVIPAGGAGVYQAGVLIRHSDPTPTVPDVHIVWARFEVDAPALTMWVLVQQPVLWGNSGYTGIWYGSFVSPPMRLADADTVSAVFKTEFNLDPGETTLQIGEADLWLERIGD